MEGSMVGRLACGRGCWRPCSRVLLGTRGVSSALAAATEAIPLISRLLIRSVSDWLVVAGGGWWPEETMTEGRGAAGGGRGVAMGEAGEGEDCIDRGIAGP